MNYKNLFSNVLERLPSVTWRRAFESSGHLRGLLQRVVLVVTERFTSEYGIAGYLYAKEVLRLCRKGGLLHTALYLKQCALKLQQFYAKHENVEGASDSIWVSTSRGGIPRIIPPFHRKIIRQGGKRGDQVVRIWLSWFGLHKLIELAKPVNSSTFKSIVSLPSNYPGVEKFIEEIIENFFSLQESYLPRASTIPIKQGMRWLPIWKALPNSVRDFAQIPKKDEGESQKGYDKRLNEFKRLIKPSCFTSLKYECLAFGRSIICFTELLGSVENTLGREYTLYALDPWIEFFSEVGEGESVMTEPLAADLFRKDLIRFSDQSTLFKRLSLGRLAASLVGSGKRRVFAIGNYIKQMLLKPYHDWAMNILRSLQTDGTYDQFKPVKPLVNKLKLHCFDLTAATDRWPLQIIFAVLSGFLGYSKALAVTGFGLGHNTFNVRRPLIKSKRAFEVSFNVGQPLGYYTSWPLFTLSHHWVMWMAARRADLELNPQDPVYRRFKAYAILGDDVVIADSRVAKHYLAICGELGVKINQSKSLISSIGGLEFAKRFFVRGRDLSPVSVRSLLMGRTTIGLLGIANKYRISKFSVLAKLGGHGYRNLGKLFNSRSRKLERLWIGFCKPDSSDQLQFMLWLGAGLVPSPYIIGLIVDYLRKRLAPKDIKILEEPFVSEDELEILERTMYHQWMLQWLQWVLWYNTVALAPNPNLNDLLFTCPVVETSAFRRNSDQVLIRFGYMWKIFDMIRNKGASYLSGILVEGSDLSARSLFFKTDISSLEFRSIFILCKLYKLGWL